VAISWELPDPSFEQFTWVLQDEHGPSSTPPLLEGGNVRPPERRDENGLPLFVRIHGFVYSRGGGTAGSGFGAPIEPESVEEMTAWRSEWLPEVERTVAMLEGFDPESVQPGHWAETLEQQVKAYERVYSGVHRSAALPVGRVAGRFTAAYCARFGEERRADAEALLQGLDNLSTARAIALWDLSRALRAEPGLLAALENSGLPPDAPAARLFNDGFVAMLAEFGHTTNADLQDLPTWREDHSIPISAVRAYALQADEHSPRAVAERQRRRRIELESELYQLAETDAAVADMLPKLAMAQQLLPNQEDHNLLVDQRMEAASRARWLAIGRLLVSRGLVRDVDDVFYFWRPELIEVLEGRAQADQALLDARRDELREARAVSPPPVLGRPRDDVATDATSAGAGPIVLRGVAASPGVYRGRARVIEHLSEAASLQAGEVMVCRSTTPTWTPFFAVAGALVTNSGGALSHAAIVAREFGLPAVVATLRATAVIPNGATVTVDGDRGVVTVEA
jgi:pyruvate,water dikinase